MEAPAAAPASAEDRLVAIAEGMNEVLREVLAAVSAHLASSRIG